MSAQNDVPDLLAPVAFGHAMRKQHFLFAPTYNPLNHGSYGTYPRLVQERFHKVQALSEARPDAFRNYDVPEMLDRSRAAIATFMNVPVDEAVLIPNASTGANVVLRSLKFEERDVIIHLSTVYGAVEKTLEYLRESTLVDKLIIDIEYPIADDELVARFQAGIKSANLAGKRVRLAVIDTISSLPGVLQPWQRLVAVCKKEGVLSLVDGAHSVGHIPLDLGQAQPDFFVSNLHKWLYVPRPCAVFHVPKRNQHIIRSSLPTSHGFMPLPTSGKEIFNPLPMQGKSPFVHLFDFVATQDLSSYLCIEEALRFRKEVCGGEEKIMNYCKQISNEAGQQAAEMLGSEVMEKAENSFDMCAFSNIKLPLKMGNGKGEVPEPDAVKVLRWMSKQLIDAYDTYAALYYHGKWFWVRISGQIYLELEDFGRGAWALNALCERVRDGEYQSDLPNQSISSLNAQHVEADPDS